LPGRRGRSERDSAHDCRGKSKSSVHTRDSSREIAA